MAEAPITKNDREVFEWIKLKEEIGSTEPLKVESGIGKLKRKVAENPFVPIGALATVGCLTYGLYNFKRGDRKMSQMMMRARVVAQGFTVFALCGGILMATMNDSSKKS